MNKPVYLDLSILEISKIIMQEFCYDYMVPKQRSRKTNLCYIDADIFIAYIKDEDICLDIAKYLDTKFDTSIYELDRPLPKGKIKKVMGLMRDELGGK